MPKKVPTDPIKKAFNSVPVDLKHLRKSASRSNKGTASGTNTLYIQIYKNNSISHEFANRIQRLFVSYLHTFITVLYTGEDDGNIPVLQRIKLIPIVTRGDDKILPILVFSDIIPNDDDVASNDHTHQLTPPSYIGKNHHYDVSLLIYKSLR